jgi:hypothetical protein
VIGRKNQLFLQSFKGAQSSTIILSLIETSKRNNVDPENILNYSLYHLSNEESLRDKKPSTYLPSTKEVQKVCKTKEKQTKAA